MFELFKTDLKRIIKDKLFLVAVIIAAGFALLNPLMNKFIFALFSEMDEGMLEMMELNAKSLFFGAFSPSNNLGLIAPILLGIVVCKDFSYGTVRNKIISGKSRTAIFLSYFLSCGTVLCVLMFLHAFLTLGTSLLFFEYQAAPFTGKDFGYLVVSLLLELLVYASIAALTCFLCVTMKNAGLAVVLYVAANFLFTIIGGVIVAARMSSSSEILRFLDCANIFMGSYIGVVASYEWFGILAVLLGSLGMTALCLTLGIVIFRKKDLK